MSDDSNTNSTTSLTSDTVLKELQAGNERFILGHSIHTAQNSLKKLKDFAIKGQLPKAIILCCSDSRGPVELIFDQDIGDLFVIRVAGNIIAPSLIGSVEFAASTFGTNLVVVMGHSNCGAVRATIDNIEHENIKSENILDIVSRIKPHIQAIAQLKNVTIEEKMDLAILANVYASVNQLTHSSTIIEKLVIKNQLKIVGAILDLNTGVVDFI